jgi:hypothetical protein
LCFRPVWHHADGKNDGIQSVGMDGVGRGQRGHQ